MKMKNIKVAKKLLNILLALVILVSLLSVGLSIYNLISYNIEASKYIYLLIGIFLLPYEFLVTGKIEGMFQEQSNIVYCLLIAIAIFIISVLVLTYASKMFNGKYSTTKRTIFGVVTNFLLFVFVGVFALGAVMLSIKYSQIENGLNNVGPEIIKTIFTNFGFNLIMIKEIVAGYLGFVVCLFSFVSFIIGMVHKSSKVKLISSINFYSSDFEEDKAITNTTTSSKNTKNEDKNNVVINDIPENDPKAKNLIKKIMQLEELKDSGKISNVDYTRLRQKAIKRYKN